MAALILPGETCLLLQRELRSGALWRGALSTCHFKGLDHCPQPSYDRRTIDWISPRRRNPARLGRNCAIITRPSRSTLVLIDNDSRRRCKGGIDAGPGSWFETTYNSPLAGRCDFRNERILSRREVCKPEKTLPVCRIPTFFSYYYGIFVKLCMFEFLYLFNSSTDRKSEPRKHQGT